MIKQLEEVVQCVISGAVNPAVDLVTMRFCVIM